MPEARAAVLVGADGVDPAAPDGAVQQEGDDGHHRQPDQGQHGDPDDGGLAEGGERLRGLRVDGNTVAVGVHQAAGQGEHAQGDDERFQAPVGDQPPVDGADRTADHQGDAEGEEHRRSAEQSGGHDGGQPESGADGDVDAAGQDHDQLGQHDHADDRQLQQQVGEVGPAPEHRPLGDGGDQQQRKQDVEGVLALQPFPEGVAEGGALLVVVDGWCGGGPAHDEAPLLGRAGSGRTGMAGWVIMRTGQSWWDKAARMRSSVSA